MSSEVSWQVELELEPERLDDFRSLTDEMVEATRTEPDALIYERFVSADRRTVWVYERYADSDAAVAHLRSFAKEFGESFGALVKRRRFTVFGSASYELRAILDEFDADCCERLAGFSRR